MMKRGASLSKKERALHDAAACNDTTEIAAQVKDGVDIQAIDNMGYNALLVALENEHPEAAAMLLFHGIQTDLQMPGTKNTALHIACDGVFEWQEVIEKLIRCDAQLDILNTDHHTPLMLAAQSGDAWAVCRLIDAGADFEKLTPEGFTPREIMQNTLAAAELQQVDDLMTATLARKAQAAAQAEDALKQSVILAKPVRTIAPITFRTKKTPSPR